MNRRRLCISISLIGIVSTMASISAMVVMLWSIGTGLVAMFPPPVWAWVWIVVNACVLLISSSIDTWPVPDVQRR